MRLGLRRDQAGADLEFLDQIVEVYDLFRNRRDGVIKVMVAISDATAILDLARVPLMLPVTVPEWASPLISIVAGQLLAMHLANVRDYDVDRPRGLRKVTETH